MLGRFAKTRLRAAAVIAGILSLLDSAYIAFVLADKLKKSGRAQGELAACKTLAITKTRETRTEQTPSIPPTDAIRPMATRT